MLTSEVSSHLHAPIYIPTYSVFVAIYGSSILSVDPSQYIRTPFP